jgi:hypothetical protein
VTMQGRGRPRGATNSSGCLSWFLIFAVALYYGVNIGEVYLRYYRLVDALDSQARLASAIDNGTIGRRIAAAVDDIGLPDSASNIVITRSADPRQIKIETSYSEHVHLPLFDHTFAFHPTATQPL